MSRRTDNTLDCRSIFRARKRHGKIEVVAYRMTNGTSASRALSISF